MPRTKTRAKRRAKLLAETPCEPVVQTSIAASSPPDPRGQEYLLDLYAEVLSSQTLDKSVEALRRESREAKAQAMAETLKDAVVIKRIPTTPYDAIYLECLHLKFAVSLGYTAYYSTRMAGFGEIYSLYEKHGKKLALFKFVKDMETQVALTGSNFISVNAALAHFKAQDADIRLLIIPVSGIISNHYRLLVLDLDAKTGTYYDPKSQAVSALTSVACSTYEAYTQMPETSTPSVVDQSFFQANLRSTQAFITKVKTAYELFMSSWLYLQKTCSQHFPGLVFHTRQLGHQALTDHDNCGVFDAEYVRLVLEGKQPQDLEAGMTADVLRLKHFEMMQAEATEDFVAGERSCLDEESFSSFGL